mmetsp:Transcript_9638/g.9303  ORF Transcript_9638/g.9303 Transcript_9638/m.9303 type:complete len:269 (-) Transcript_9638:2068-2874(-)
MEGLVMVPFNDVVAADIDDDLEGDDDHGEEEVVDKVLQRDPVLVGHLSLIIEDPQQHSKEWIVESGEGVIGVVEVGFEEGLHLFCLCVLVEALVLLHGAVLVLLVVLKDLFVLPFFLLLGVNIPIQIFLHLPNFLGEVQGGYFAVVPVVLVIEVGLVVVVELVDVVLRLYAVIIRELNVTPGVALNHLVGTALFGGVGLLLGPLFLDLLFIGVQLQLVVLAIPEALDALRELGPGILHRGEDEVIYLGQVRPLKHLDPHINEVSHQEL